MTPKTKTKLLSIAKKLASIKTSSDHEAGLEDYLIELLQSEADIEDVSSFAEGGVMTNNTGLNLKYKGKDFQLTIVMSSPSSDEDYGDDD